MEPTKDSYPQLISFAVHEFRTPASVVGGYLRMLSRDSDALSDRQRKMIDEAEKSCARLVAIVGELSDVAKLDAGVVALARQPIDVFSLVDQVAALVHEAKDRDVRLEVRGPAEGATMSGDGTRLRSAFDAIFRGILREKVGECTVVAERRIVRTGGKQSAILVVADESSVQTAYDSQAGPFDDKRGGMGLALALARRVIEGHGGRIWSPMAQENVDHDPLSRGSAIISLPITESAR